MLLLCVAFVLEKESREFVVRFFGYLEKALAGANPGFYEEAPRTPLD